MHSKKLCEIKDSGFEAFIQGEFGNAGQNIYVSKQGVLQRIHQFDVNRDGYIDLPIVNSQDDEPRVPAYVYVNPLENEERLEIPTDGAYAGAVGDLNNDGYDDLVIANQYDGVSNYVYAQIYYGSPSGYSTQRMFKLWAPSCKSVAMGDFKGEGRKAIAFVSLEKLRLFYQEEAGFRTAGYIELDLDHTLDSVASADLDGDGYDDLVIRTNESTVVVYWGGPDGLQHERRTWLDQQLTGVRQIAANIDRAASGASTGNLFVYQVPKTPRFKIVTLSGRPHIFISRDELALFVPFQSDRSVGNLIVLDSGEAMNAASGDIRGIGAEDIVLATRQTNEEGAQRSWIYWGTNEGYSNANRTAFTTQNAYDVAVEDLDGDGCDDVIVCQDKTDESYTFESLIYRGSSEGLTKTPVRLETHCAMAVFAANTMDSERPQVIFLNHLSNRILGNIPAYIYLGGPDGFSPERKIELPGWAATEVRIADYNDDGWPDVFIANCNENAMHLDNGSYIYWGSPDGFALDRKIELPTKHTMSSCTADLNRDGYLDLIVVGHANDELLIFYGSEHGFEDEPERIRLVIDGVVYKQPRFMTLADLNNDGWLDLVIPDCGATEDLLILWGSPDGFDIKRRTLLPEGAGISTRAADLTGNGWLDLIVGGFKGPDPVDPYGTFIYIYWGGPEGYANDRRTQLPAKAVVDLAVADFNNDGVLDIFAACYHDTRTRDLDCYIYWGEPGGSYSAENYTNLFHHSAAGVLAADFNEDGYVDLAAANHKTFGNHPGMSYVWWNGPEGFASQNRTELPTLGPHGITHSDIGNVLDRGPEEYYISRVMELPEGSSLLGISWTAEIPQKTWVKAQVRTASSEEELQTAAWIGIEGEDSWFDHDSRWESGRMKGKWIQYKLALGALNSGSTPRVREVKLIYDQD